MKKLNNLWIITLLFLGLVFTLNTGCTKTEDLPDGSSAGTVKDKDGNVYQTVKIGTQVWMTENLKTTKYNNGDPINNVTDNSAWSDLSTGAWCNYDNDVTTGNKYGKLYNWYAVKTGNLAPSGWHVPTYAEWEALAMYVTANSGTSGCLAKALAATTDWASSTDAYTVGNSLTKNNSSGFSALPGGYRNYGTFRSVGKGGYWWSSSEDGGYDALDISFDSNDSIGYRGSEDKAEGLSVRLIKDYTHSLPKIETTIPIVNSANTANCGGKIITNGGEIITARGVCWSTSTTPTISNSKTNENVETAVFTSLISGLKPSTKYYARAYATNSLGTVYGAEVSFTTTPSVTVMDIESNIYHTITIGTQTWMIENLKTTKYNDGTSIPLVTDSVEWENLYGAGYCWYKNIKNSNGALYNWKAIQDTKLAPIGWHVPSDTEWSTLRNFVSTHLDTSSSVAKALAANTNWAIDTGTDNIGNDLTKNNSSGFSALPCGVRTSYGSFDGLGQYGCWWSTTIGSIRYGVANFYYGYYVNYIQMNYNSNTVNGKTISAGYYSVAFNSNQPGFSVRCIKD